jgi:hypothetical protein
MAQVRNISPNALLVGDQRVDVDELFDVPDEAFLDRAWPTSMWKLITPPRDGRDVSPADAICYTAAEPEPPAPQAEVNVESDGQE